MTLYDLIDGMLENGNITEEEYDEVMHELHNIRPNITRIITYVKNWRKS